MPNYLPAPLTFYPAYCFSLSPTHNTWARLTAADVHGLHDLTGFEGQNLYFHLNHPIKWIRLVGVIVAVDIHPTRWIALLDDSSGATIEITCGRPAPTPTTQTMNLTTLAEYPTGVSMPDAFCKGVTATRRDVDLSGVDIGTVVKVKGGVGSFREVKQVLLERICTSTGPLGGRQGLTLCRRLAAIVGTTNEEAAAWAENTAFRREILSKPWVVSEEDEERARRKAEGLDREKRSREERKRRKRREEEDGKRAALEKERRRGERKRREEGQRRRDGEAGPSRRGADGEYKERRRGIEKARRPRPEVSDI